MNLAGIIEGPGPISEIAGHLENLSPSERWKALAGLSKRQQRTLYLKAECSEPATSRDLVAEGTNALVEVIHAGKNTLPVFRSFEKRFTRGPDGQIFGYNEGTLRPVLGPGYFVLRDTQGKEVPRGAIVVDYFQVPPSEPVPPGWPTVRANWFGLQVLVYHHTRDYLRRVAPGILIGSAWKTVLGREFCLNSYFVLMRKD